MQPSIFQLKSIFNNKLAVAKELKKYVKPVSEFANDNQMVFIDESQQSGHWILETHFFGKNKGLMPLIEKLIELNRLLLAYEKPFPKGELAGEHFDRMIELVHKEQKFLINYFKPTLIDVVKNKNYEEHWKQSFSGYEALMNIIRLDLTHFSLILQTLAKYAVLKIIDTIDKDDYEKALSFLGAKDAAEILDSDEIRFFQELATLIKNKDLEKARNKLAEGRNLLEKDEFGLLAYVIEKKIQLGPSGIDLERDIRRKSKDDFHKIINFLANANRFEPYDTSDSYWLWYNKGSIKNHNVRGYENARKQWKLFINPKPKYFLRVFGAYLKKLRDFDGILLKLLADNSYTPNKIYSDPNEPKFLIYFIGDDAKEKLKEVTIALSEIFDDTTTKEYGYDEGVRDGYIQLGPSFTNPYNKLLFYTQGGFRESEREKICNSTDRWANEKKLILFNRFEGYNFYIYKGESDPFGFKVWKYPELAPISHEELMYRISKGKSIRGHLPTLKWTHNTVWNANGNGLKNILELEVFYGSNKIPVCFRFGIDAGYGEIVVIMKDDIEKTVLRRGYITQIASHDKHTKSRVMYGIDLTQYHEKMQEFKERIILDTDFRKNYERIGVDSTVLFANLDAGNYRMDYDLRNMYLRSYFNPQLDSYSSIDISLIESIIVPEHLWNEVVGYYQQNRNKLNAKGITEQTFLKANTGDIGKFTKNIKFRNLFRWGHQRPEQLHGKFEVAMGVKAFFLIEQVYFRYIADNKNRAGGLPQVSSGAVPVGNLVSNQEFHESGIEKLIIEKCVPAALSQSRRGLWKQEMLRSLGEGFGADFIISLPDGWLVAVIFQLNNPNYGYAVPHLRAYQKNLSEWFKTDDTDELISSLVTPAHVVRDSGAPHGWRVWREQKGKVRCNNSTAAPAQGELPEISQDLMNLLFAVQDAADSVFIDGAFQDNYRLTEKVGEALPDGIKQTFVARQVRVCAHNSSAGLVTDFRNPDFISVSLAGHSYLLPNPRVQYANMFTKYYTGDINAWPRFTKPAACTVDAAGKATLTNRGQLGVASQASARYVQPSPTEPDRAVELADLAAKLRNKRLGSDKRSEIDKLLGEEE